MPFRESILFQSLSFSRWCSWWRRFDIGKSLITVGFEFEFNKHPLASLKATSTKIHSSRRLLFEKHLSSLFGFWTNPCGPSHKAHQASWERKRTYHSVGASPLPSSWLTRRPRGVLHPGCNEASMHQYVECAWWVYGTMWSRILWVARTKVAHFFTSEMWGQVHVLLNTKIS